MKWFYLYIAAVSMGFNGPFDTQEECVKALITDRANFFGVIDPGFYGNATYDGLCFQGIKPPRASINKD